MSTQSNPNLKALCLDETNTASSAMALPTLPTTTINRLKPSLKALCPDKTYAVSSAMTPANPKKRTSQEAEVEPIRMRSNTYTTIKKPCLLPVGAKPNTHMSIDGGHLSLLTPPETPPVPAVRTMRIKLEIPQKDILKEENQKLKLGEAPAEKPEPKLKRPFPRKREMKGAYNTKPTRPPPELPVIRPPINRSARVDNLLKGLSVVLKSTKNVDGTKKITLKTQTRRDEAKNSALNDNKRITHSNYAKVLAWRAFSSNEQERADRGRQAMIISGLDPDDLTLEKKGFPNDLPEWKKTKTGPFARKMNEKR